MIERVLLKIQTIWISYLIIFRLKVYDEENNVNRLDKDKTVEPDEVHRDILNENVSIDSTENLSNLECTKQKQENCMPPVQNKETEFESRKCRDEINRFTKSVENGGPELTKDTQAIQNQNEIVEDVIDNEGMVMVHITY